MSFESFSEAQSFFLIAAFIIAFIMGAVVNKTNFCTMGAVSDWVNMGDKGRLRAWLLAMAVAIIGVVIFESMGMVNADGAFPPYRNGNFAWIENLLGGILFGIGMTYGSGCGNKTLVRIGGGNLKSVIVLLVMGVIAYFMVNPFPNSDATIYSAVFYPWTNPLSINVGTAQDLGTLVAGAESAVTARLIIGLILAAAIIWFTFKDKDFRSSFDNVLGGVVVGLAVFAAWWMSSAVLLDLDGDFMSMGNYYSQWDFLADSAEGKPAEGAPLSPQSFTFVNPMGQTFGLAYNGFDTAYITFGVMALVGVILGSFAWAIVSKGFRIEWFKDAKDVINHVIGAVLMAVGGVLALGCTIGQGVTGISTLAIGSFVAFIGIVFGSALTMKIQFYKLCYEDASFIDYLITALVDMKLLPGSMRKLDAL